MCGNFKVTKFQANYDRRRAQIERERVIAQRIEFAGAVGVFTLMILFATLA